MAFIISERLHHLKNRLGFCSNLNKLLRFHSTKSDLYQTTPLTTHEQLPHKMPHNIPPHKINLDLLRSANVTHQQIESIKCYEPEDRMEKNDWPATFLVFDIETTGYMKLGERIIEVAIRDCSGGDKSIFQSLVNPGIEVTNSEFHGITTFMVRQPGVPKMEKLIPIMLEFVKSRQVPDKRVVLVAHNGKTFDFPFLRREFQECGFEFPDEWLFLDTYHDLAKKCKTLLGLENLQLQNLIKHFKIPLQGPAHRAMEDVNLLCLLLAKLTVELKKTPSDLLQDALLNANKKTKSKAPQSKLDL